VNVIESGGNQVISEDSKPMLLGDSGTIFGATVVTSYLTPYRKTALDLCVKDRWLLIIPCTLEQEGGLAIGRFIVFAVFSSISACIERVYTDRSSTPILRLVLFRFEFLCLDSSII
jgi:hypothetical protein